MDADSLNNYRSHSMGHEILTNLIRGESKGITFIEITEEAFHLIPVYASRSGVPYIAYEHVRLASLAVLLQGCNETIGNLETLVVNAVDVSTEFKEAISKALGELLKHLKEGHSHKFVINQRSDGSPLDRIVEDYLKEREYKVVRYEWPLYASGPNNVTLEERILWLIGSTPLLYPYGLVVANIDPLDRRVFLSTRTLYQAGTSSWEHPLASIEIESAAKNEDVILAVVAQRSKSLEKLDDSDLVACAALKLPAPQRCLLNLRLIAPGMIEMDADSEHLSVDPFDTRLTDMLNQIPTVIERPETRQIDMVFILDEIASPELLEERRKFIEDVIGEVRKELHQDGCLRVGVLVYGASNFPASKREAPYKGNFLTDDLDRISQFLTACKSSSGNRFEAAFEDALTVLYRFNWERSKRRFVIAVGNRPPYPFLKEYTGQLASPLKYDWRVLLTGLRSYLRINFISIVCPIFWHVYDDTKKTYALAPGLPDYAEDYAMKCWREIGYTKALKIERVKPEEVAGLVVAKPKSATPELRIPVQVEPRH